MKKKRIKRLLIFIFSALIITVTLSLIASHGYDAGAVEDYLPDCIREYLPELSSQTLDSGELLELTDASAFFETIGSMLKSALKTVFSDFAGLCGILISASLIHITLELSGSESLRSAGEYVGILCVTVFSYRLCDGVWSTLEDMLSSLGVMINALLGSMSALYTAGGSVTTAAVTTCTISAALAVMQNVCQYLLRPVMMVCLGFTIVSEVTDSNLNGLAELIRNIFTIALTFVMTIFSAILSYQTSIASGADNLAARTVRFTEGNADTDRRESRRGFDKGARRRT